MKRSLHHRSYYQISLVYVVYIIFLVKMGIICEVSTYINVYICKVAEPPSHPVIFPCDPLE